MSVVLRGRDHQIAVLEELLVRARSGRGGALSFLAEPGMGKTALLECAVRWADPDFRTLGIRGIRQESSLELAGLHRLLGPVADRIEGLPACQAESLTRVFDGDGAVDPFALCTAVHALLTETSRSGPVLCWIDDVHWLDRASLDAMTFTARRLGDKPVVMLFAAHNEHVTTPERDRLGTGPDAAVKPWALAYLAMADLWLGRYPSATAHSLEGLRLARAAGQENHAVDHLATMALLAALQGDKDTARLRLDAVSDAAAKRGLARPGAFTSWALACLELIEDRPADAAGRIRLMTGTWHAHPVVHVMATPHFVEAAVRCDERKGALQALEVFDRWATSTRNSVRLALSHRCHALLAGDDAEADEHFREALRLHLRGDSAFEMARTELLYGHRLRRERKPRAAREHLRNALQIFEYYDAEHWTESARAELRAAGETAAPPTAPKGAAELTAQQHQIARLAAEGATNREIAARLVLSHRTVDHHLRNVFVRLGIRSRVELSRFFS